MSRLPHLPPPRPRTLQSRLTLAFVGVVALTLVLVSILVLNRLEDYFLQQEQQNLRARTGTVAALIDVFTDQAAGRRPVVRADNTVDPVAAEVLSTSTFLHSVANTFAAADVQVRLGQLSVDSQGNQVFIQATGADYRAPNDTAPLPGQAPESITTTTLLRVERGFFQWAIEVTLANPYTYRASTVAAVTGLLLVGGLVALAFSIVLAAVLASRFTTPLRRLTEASRRLAQGNLDVRVPTDLAGSGGAEIAELSGQFNAMAAQLQESVGIIRRDRDRSRDFLADVSHELRTPLAALRTFNELLKEQAGDDPEARAEFLESSGGQIDRLDWLAQNLLELSKLDSGLVLLDLRPEDLRACIESAVEQADAAARKRGVDLRLELPDHPVRIRHDPQRIGQVVSNLVGNALKFTPRGGSVVVELRPEPDGARIDVRDTGVGIDATELPRIFDRFYRGAREAEARASGSGLGLAIVRSIVEMHGGRVVVESALGAGSTFRVTLPRDPRVAGLTTETPAGASAGTAPPDGSESPIGDGRRPIDVAISSPTEVSRLNQRPSG